MHQFLKTACVCERIFEPYTVSHCRNRQFGIGEKFFGFVDPEFCHILMYCHAGVFLKQFAEIVFGKADAVAYGVDIQI